MASKQRIYAIDVLRGLTVAAMIMVNNAGGKLSYSCLRHAEWNGMTLCDMVFPSFLFIVGLTAYISLSKTKFVWSSQTFAKILRRTIIILLIGWAIHWIDLMCEGQMWPVANLRLTGVLPRIALCYFAVSILALCCKQRTIYVITIGLLILYSFILIFGNGYANDSTNILAKVDNAILGTSHIYSKRPIDPEGLLGTFSSIAHTLIGFCFGRILIDRSKSLDRRLLDIMVWGFILLLAGLSLSLGMPLNKRIWSPSFVLTSCGLVAMALSAISYATDLNGCKRPFKLFDVFGVNPLFLYVLSELLAIVLSAANAKPVVYNVIFSLFPEPYIASAIYSVLFVAVLWLAGYPLYKKKIYIKI